MNQKLIFLDIDGTILIPGEGIRQSVRDGLRRARARRHRIFICTGRACRMLPEELQDMELDGVIASAGSDIWIHGQNVYRRFLPETLVRKAIRIIRELSGICVLEGCDQIYLSEEGMQILREERSEADENPELFRWREFFRKRTNVQSIDLWEPDRSPIPKVTFILNHREDANQLCEYLEKEFYVALFPQESGSICNGELISRTDNKGTAVRHTADFLHVDIWNTVAFGDSMNDYQMLEQAGCAVAMGNADEELEKIADRICEPVEDDGVIRELERMKII